MHPCIIDSFLLYESRDLVVPYKFSNFIENRDKHLDIVN